MTAATLKVVLLVVTLCPPTSLTVTATGKEPYWAYVAEPSTSQIEALAVLETN